MSATLAPYRIIVRYFIACRWCSREVRVNSPDGPLPASGRLWLLGHCSRCLMVDEDCECQEPQRCGTAHKVEIT